MFSSNEKRLIDANSFLKDILSAGIGKTIVEYSESDIGYMIRKRPTVDAVEVVRCHYCKFYKDEKNGMVYCLKHFGWVPNDWFCADGKQKE